MNLLITICTNSNSKFDFSTLSLIFCRSLWIYLKSDDKYSKFFIKICKKNKIRILDYGKDAKYLKIIKIIKRTNTIETHLQLNHKRFCVNFPCYASYQVYNQICAFLLVFGKKLNKKNCDLIIANDVSNKKIGFNSDFNEVSIFFKNNNSEKLKYKLKSEISDEVAEKIINHLN